MFMSASFFLVVFVAVSGGKTERINLVDFGRVVRFEGDSAEKLEVRALERGPDGWEAWLGEDDQYMIGVEWDEPHDIAEVNIEFRHAIAGREQIRVQYWQDHWPVRDRGGWAELDDPFHGKWATAKVAEWWAGDRDISFTFTPFKEEQPGKGAFQVRFRRTYRLRFLLGKQELPPVRYIRAYGRNESAEATFDVALGTPSATMRSGPGTRVPGSDSPLKPPLNVAVVNGYVVEQEDGKRTTTQSSAVTKEPISLKVVYATGDLDTPTRTIVTLRDNGKPAKGVSFLPIEAVKEGVIRVPSLGVTVEHRGSTTKPAESQKGASVYDRVDKEPEQTFERARREIPELRKTKQKGRPMYLPLGPPDARQEIAVNYDGSIFLDKSALKVPAADSQRVKWPADGWYLRLTAGEPAFDISAEGAVKQKLLDGFLPIVINTWETGGVQYEQTCAATFLDGEPKEIKGDETVVLVMRLKISNAGSTPAKAVVHLSSDPAEVYAQEGSGISAVGRIGRDGNLKQFPQPRCRFHARATAGEISLVDLQNNGHKNTFRYGKELAAGESQTLFLAVPFLPIDTGQEKEHIVQRLADADQVIDSEADRWRTIIARQAVFEVPDPLLNDFYKAQLAHILITADRDPFNGTRILSAATFAYSVCLNESCHQIRSLEIRGLHEEARQFLDAFLAGQSSMPMHGRFTDKKGAFNGLPSKNGDYQEGQYNLDHGFALWTLNEHFRFTHDRQWLEKHAGALISACDFITRQRTVPPESNTLAKDDTSWGVGLMPPGHLEDPPEWLWWFAVNAYAYRGMQATADSLREIKHPEAERIARDAEDFGNLLRRSCQESMLRAPVVRLRDGTYVPHQPTRSRLRGRDLGWIRDALYGPVHLIDCGVYAVDSPEAEWLLRDAEDNVFIGEERGRKLTDYDKQWFSWGGITLQSNLLPNPLVYLRRGQSKHAIRAFYNSLAANVYADVRTFCEHPIDAYGIGQGPFFKSPDESAFIVWLRHLLIAEKGHDLELLAGVPQGWLAPGKTINIKGAATWFGPMDMSVQSTEGQTIVKLSPPQRNPPANIRVHLRWPQPVHVKVNVNGQPSPDFQVTREMVTLPGKLGPTEVIISTGGQ